MKKDFDNLTEEALTNIREDRQQTNDLLKDLIKYISGAEDRHRDVGLTAAKYVETLQRSNEQLVKISSIIQRGQKTNVGLSKEDKNDIFDLINEEVPRNE